MEQILLYILIFIIAIVSSVRKNKKKTQQAQQQAKKVEKTVVEQKKSEFQDFIQQLKEQFGEDIPEDKKLQPIQTEQPISFNKKRNYTDKERKLTDSKVYIESKLQGKNVKTQKNLTILETEEEVAEDIDIQFVEIDDARKAFIFSEIWNRKYV